SHMDWPINAVRWRSADKFVAPGYPLFNPSMDGVGCNGNAKRIPRHQEGLNFLFADGHAKWLRLGQTIFPVNLFARDQTLPENDSRTNFLGFYTRECDPTAP